MTRLGHVSALVCAVVTGASALGAASASADGPPSAVKDLTVGIEFDQPGLSVMRHDGGPVGFDADVARYVAKSLGYDESRIRWVQAPPERRESMIQSHAVDFAIGAYAMTESRKKLVAFAGPYLIAGQDLLVRSEDTDITGPEALDGKTVCAASGSTSADEIRKNLAAGVRTRSEPTISACVGDLRAGTVDAVTDDDVVLAGFAAAHPARLKVVGHPFTRERYAIGLAKGDPGRQQAITAAITTMIQDESWAESLERNFGPSGYRIPIPPRVFLPADENGRPQGPSGVDPALAAVATATAAKINAQDWPGLAGLSSAVFTLKLPSVVSQVVPVFDTNLPADALKDVTYRVELVGLHQVDADHAEGVFHAVDGGVPARYRDYFRDADLTAQFVKQDVWRLDDVAVDFEETG